MPGDLEDPERSEVPIDLADVSKPDVEPGEPPEKMAAWVIREETQGEPKDAFRLEETETPEPGAFEVIVREVAAGVNFNNVRAALGTPVSVFGYGNHPGFGHHIGGTDASGVVWKVGEGVTRWKPGDEVVVHCNQASCEDVEVHGLDPLAAPSQRIRGYKTTRGSGAPRAASACSPFSPARRPGPTRSASSLPMKRANWSSSSARSTRSTATSSPQ